MHKKFLNIKKHLKKLTNLVLSTIDYFKNLFNVKKTIDVMYSPMLDNKTNDIKLLKNELKTIQNKNSNLKKEITTLKSSLHKKYSIIENLQELISKRIE